MIDKIECSPKYAIPVDWFTSCGRTWLSINGYVAAVEGDQCRDADLQRKFQSEYWTTEMIKFVVEETEYPK